MSEVVIYEVPSLCGCEGREEVEGLAQCMDPNCTSAATLRIPAGWCRRCDRPAYLLLCEACAEGPER